MIGDRRFRAALLGVALAMNGIPAKAGISGFGHEGSGLTYRYRAVSMIKSTSADTSKTVEVIGVVSAAEGRGRLQITRSTFNDLLPGDFCLFDSSGTIIVRPSNRAFFALGGPAAVSELIKTAKVTDLKSHVDAIDGADTVDGHETAHYRSRLSYTVTFGPDAGVLALKSYSANLVTDYWLMKATETGTDNSSAPPSVLQGKMPGDAFAGLRKRMQSVQETISAKGFPLKTISAVATRGLDGIGVDVTSTVWISGIKVTAVDRNSLVLPRGFVADTGTLRAVPPDKDIVRFRKLPQGPR